MKKHCFQLLFQNSTTIVGDNLRATTVKPAPGLDSGGSIVNQRSTLFRCSNGVIIQDIICEGMDGYQVGSPASDPTAGTLGGVYFALNGQVLLRISHHTSIT